MKELTKKILLALGFTQVQIDDMESEAPKGVESELISGIVDHQKKLLRNDADFVGEIKSAEKGRILSLNEQLVKKTFGLSAEETKDKNFAEIVALGQAKLMSKSGATTEELQKELVAANSRIKDFEENEIPKIRGEVESHKKKINVNFKLAELIGGYDFSVAKPAAQSAFMAHVDAKFDLTEDDKGEIVVKVKGSDLSPKNADGTKILGIKDIAQSTFEEWGFLKKSNAPPAPPAPIHTGKEGQATKSYATNDSMSAAERNLKENMPKKAQV